MADMGALLSVGLFYTLVCTLFVLPALLGSPRPSSRIAKPA
jgi:predicted RND superfamily exporter protein